MPFNHSFLIPLFNEESNIAQTIATIQQAVSVIDSYEIIIVDDASSDRSLEIVEKISQYNPNILIERHLENRGFAKAYQTALNRATGTTCQYIPSDNVISVEDLTKLLSAKDKADVVFQYCLNPKERVPLRSFISRAYTYVLNKIHQRSLSYYNGLNIYPREFLNKQQIKSDSFAFQAELAIAAMKKLSYTQVGITCNFKDDTSSAMTLSNFLNVMFFIFKQLRRPS